MDKKKVRVLKYQDHPELENKVVECVIMNNENIKSRMKNKIAPRKPKQPRMTVAQLATTVAQLTVTVNQIVTTVSQQGTKIDQLTTTVNNLVLEMRAGFVAINHRIDKEVGSIKEVLKRNNIS
jgi:hypothetical protein